MQAQGLAPGGRYGVANTIDYAEIDGERLQYAHENENGSIAASLEAS